MNSASAPERPSKPSGTVACSRREEILDAAIRLFAEQGFSDAVTQLLADTLGVGKGTLYRHFPSKRELFFAAVERVMNRLQEHVDAATRDVSDGLDRIRAGVASYLDFFRQHPEYVEILVQERAQFSDRENPTFFVHRQRHVQRWRDLYRRLIGEGRIREMEPEAISNAIFAGMYGAMFLNDYGGRSGAFAIDADSLIDVMFRGILSEPERASLSRHESKTAAN